MYGGALPCYAPLRPLESVRVILTVTLDMIVPTKCTLRRALCCFQDSAFCHHAGHLGAIGLGAVDILHQFQAIGGMACSVGNGRFIQLLTEEGSLDGAGPRGLDRGTSDDDTGGRAGAIAAKGDHCCAARHSIVPSFVR